MVFELIGVLSFIALVIVGLASVVLGFYEGSRLDGSTLLRGPVIWRSTEVLHQRGRVPTGDILLDHAKVVSSTPETLLFTGRFRFGWPGASLSLRERLRVPGIRGVGTWTHDRVRFEVRAPLWVQSFMASALGAIVILTALESLAVIHALFLLGFIMLLWGGFIMGARDAARLAVRDIADYLTSNQ